MEKKKIKEAVKRIIEAVGDDPDREGLKRTPQRVADMLEDVLKGMKEDPEEVIRVYHTTRYDEIIIIKDIPFYSFCEHHLLPFFGNVNIAYIPKDDRITGYSNLVDVVDVYSKRFQLQERMTAQIADTIMSILDPLGVFVIIEARQLCLEMQGSKKQGETTVTSAIRGAFERERTRLEALNLMER